MAGPGVLEMRELLSTPSAELAASMKRVADGLRVHDADAQVSSDTFAAIDEVRAFYRALRAQIARVQTRSTAQEPAIDALTRLDRGLRLFARGLHDETSEVGTDRINEGVRRTKAAAADLADVLRSIS